MAARFILTMAGRNPVCRRDAEQSAGDIADLLRQCSGGYAVLATALEKDAALRDKFFKNLSIIAYGGARLPDDLYERMQALSIAATGQRVVFTTGWGSTETAPTATSTYWETERVGLIGVPYPGVELKMVPVGDLYELRLRGVIVTPGSHGQPDPAKAAFNEEGFYESATPVCSSMRMIRARG